MNSINELAGLPVEAQRNYFRVVNKNFTRLLIENISAEDPKLDSAIIADHCVDVLRRPLYNAKQTSKVAKASSEAQDQRI